MISLGTGLRLPVGPGVCLSLLTVGAQERLPGGGVSIDCLAQPPQRRLFLTHAKVYEQLAMAQCQWSELSHRVGEGVCVLSPPSRQQIPQAREKDVVAETGLCSVRNRHACPCRCARQIACSALG